MESTVVTKEEFEDYVRLHDLKRVDSFGEWSDPTNSLFVTAHTSVYIDNEGIAKAAYRSSSWNNKVQYYIIK